MGRKCRREEKRGWQEEGRQKRPQSSTCKSSEESILKYTKGRSKKKEKRVKMDEGDKGEEREKCEKSCDPERRAQQTSATGG